MTQDTTPASGAADLPKALRLAAAISNLLCSNEAAARTLAAAADELVRLHAESEMRRAALLDEMQKAALAAGQATAAQAVVPAEWPTNEMIDAGRKAAASQGRLLGSGQSLWHVFRAMIAAAPAQPAVQQGVVCGSDEPFTGTCGSRDPRALCKQPTTTALADSVLNDHQIAALVNELRDIAIQYHGAQQLRERIAQVVVPAIRAAQADNVQEEAARYRLLRRCKGQEHEPPFTVQHEIDGTLWGGDLDAAIDSARKQGTNHD